MKRLLFALLLSLSTLVTKAQCDWTGVTFEQISQRGNAFYYETNMHYDSCWDYIFTVYDYQRKAEDTMSDFGGWFGVEFTAKGKYQVRMIAFNRCLDCDTVFSIDVNIVPFGKVSGDFTVSKKTCRGYSFEMTDMKDTCIEYYWNIWRADDWINQMSDKYWKALSDSALYWGYSWDEELIEYYNLTSERTFNYEFKDSGRYILIAQFYNRCTQLDTWMFRKISVCNEDIKTTSIKTITKEDLNNVTIEGYYDMLGRRVDALLPNKIYIILYSNGRRQKVMQIN